MLPNLITIGAMKCGTTSLHFYLNLHPEIKMSSPKELDFFIEKFNWKQGVDWYQSHFQGEAKIYGESSPNYADYSRWPEVPERMHLLVPHAKLVYLVRDPIARMISQYIHMYSFGSENRPIEEALIDVGKNSYLNRSLYYQQLERFLAYYNASQILVIESEELSRKTLPTLQKVFNFLGVDTTFQTWQYAIKRHSSKRKRRKTPFGTWLSKTPSVQLLNQLPQRWRWPIEDLLYFPFSQPIERPELSGNLLGKLQNLLQDDVNQLRNFTGCDFNNWQV